MKKIIRNTNDLLLSVMMCALSIFLLVSPKIITGVENGLGGYWAKASTYIHLLAGLLLAIAILILIDTINFKGTAEHVKLTIPVSPEIVITAISLVAYAVLLPILTFFPCTLTLNAVLCGLFARKENEGNPEIGKKLPKKQLIVVLVYSVILTIVLWVLFTKILKCVLP